MNTCYVVRPSRPAGLFSFGLLDGLQVRLRRPYLREAPAGFGLERLATAFINNPGCNCWSVSQSVGEGEFCFSTVVCRCTKNSLRLRKNTCKLWALAQGPA
jgi:hypothetical protein